MYINWSTRLLGLEIVFSRATDDGALIFSLKLTRIYSNISFANPCISPALGVSPVFFCMNIKYLRQWMNIIVHYYRKHLYHQTIYINSETLRHRSFMSNSDFAHVSKTPVQLRPKEIFINSLHRDLVVLTPNHQTISHQRNTSYYPICIRSLWEKWSEAIRSIQICSFQW